ncbi:MAG: hypothetical protein ACRCYQ_00590 [Nocardioides sp.]
MTFDFSHEPMGYRVMLLTSKPGETVSRFVSALGTPPDFDEPYVIVRGKTGGTYVEDLSSAPIDQQCDDSEGAPELVLVFEVDQTGAKADSMTVAYHVGGTKYTTRFDWVLAACGSAEADATDCDSA